MATTNSKTKKTVAEIIIERFLRDVEEKGTMPWQRPYERYNAFNYFTKVPYRGINRLMLPFGEYITKNQIMQYNINKGYLKLDSNGKVESMTEDAFKFQKGIMWFPVVFFKKDKRKSDLAEIREKFPKYTGGAVSSELVHIGREGIWNYYVDDTGIYKSRNILRYYEVADRRFFRNGRGECLPSRIDMGEVEMTLSDPKKVFDNYIEREGIKLDTDCMDTPCYVPIFDLIRLNPTTKSEGSWYSCAFHEAGHSTGARSRLNRVGITGTDMGNNATETYAREEVIAEICACLCCAETGIFDYETSGTAEYDNNIAYVQSWKKRIKDWGSDFIYIVSEADKAFNYICSDPDSDIPDTGENSSLK